MNLPLIGKRTEEEAKQFHILYGAKKMPYHHPFDYLSKGIKIDVKSYELKKKNSDNTYRFHVQRTKHIADMYLCMGYKDGKLKNAYLIPAYKCPLTEIKISLSPPHKYEAYRMM